MQQKIDEYVDTYKIIDSTVLVYLQLAAKFRKNSNSYPAYEHPDKIVQLYEGIGMPDITIDWDDIEHRLHMPREFLQNEPVDPNSLFGELPKFESSSFWTT